MVLRTRRGLRAFVAISYRRRGVQDARKGEGASQGAGRESRRLPSRGGRPDPALACGRTREAARRHPRAATQLPPCLPKQSAQASASSSDYLPEPFASGAHQRSMHRARVLSLSSYSRITLVVSCLATTTYARRLPESGIVE